VEIRVGSIIREVLVRGLKRCQHTLSLSRNVYAI
jgi:hypothetical protein